MRAATRRMVATAALLVSAACASSGGAGGNRGSRDVLTEEQIRATNLTNAYDVVQSLRSNWLNDRGPDTIIGKQGVIQVYLDESRYGTIESLRSIPTAGIQYIRWYDGISASSRWGLDHGKGVIYVSLRPMR